MDGETLLKIYNQAQLTNRARIVFEKADQILSDMISFNDLNEEDAKKIMSWVGPSATRYRLAARLIDIEKGFK